MKNTYGALPINAAPPSAQVAQAKASSVTAKTQPASNVDYGLTDRSAVLQAKLRVLIGGMKHKWWQTPKFVFVSLNK